MKKICSNCMDYDHKNKVCIIRFNVLEDKSRIPMKRSPNKKGCSVFLMKYKT